MKARLITILLAFCCLLLPAESPEGTVPRRAQRPAWMKEGVVMAGNWEPLSFIRRRGGQTYADEENWKKERTEEAARRLKEAGVTLVITNLVKGLGLQAEAADIEATRQFTRHAHKYGLKVGGYIGATLFYETLFAEEPGSSDWKQVNEQGQAMYYSYSGGQTFRYTACRNNPGYHRFLEKVMRLGVEDIGLDLIHFDQMEGWAEPDSCRCRHCAEQFRQYLRARYTDAELDGRLGFHRLDGIIPPPFGVTRGPILMPELTNPLMQDWARFRSYSYARRYAEYDAFLEKMNSQVALEGNPNLDLSVNRGFLQGVDIPQLLSHGDVVWSEEPNHAEWTSDGRLVSKIRSFKAARLMGKSIFVYTGGRYGSQSPASPPELRLAEAMAYNDYNLGMVGDVAPGGISLTPAAKRYIRFFQEHKQDLSATRPKADAAVLRAFAATEFNPGNVLPATVLFEQTLIQAKVPFEIIFDQQLADLSRYKVLVLAGQDALSDQQAEAIRRFVRNGGGVVATGATSLLDEARRRRGRFALADLFGSEQPPKESVRRTFGKGRVVYLSAIQPQVAPPQPRMTYQFANSNWKLPKNYQELTEAVQWAAAEPLSATVQAPLSVTLELAERASSNSLLLHLVNFDFRNAVTGIDATVRIPEGFRVREVVSDSPDSGSAIRLTTTVENGQVKFRIPRLQVYNLAVIRLEKK
ncbi:MAG: beta-galactosidase trimerization domain-containing protein [Acidobacteria bacterium]|nr:beta-galactosidase trimerization domain-containing protein [Acidobacteriota bacterium]